MIKFMASCLAVILMSQTSLAQVKVFGYLKGENNQPLEYASIGLGDDHTIQTKSDRVGYFQIKDLKPGAYLAVIQKNGYDPLFFKFVISSNETKKNLGDIKLEYNPSQVEIGLIPLTDDEIFTDDNSSGQTGIGLLQSSKDAFSKTASYELGNYWFKVRGLDNKYNNVIFNGTPMTKSYSGRPDFSNWSGLNDVIKYPYELTENNKVSYYSFSNLGGTIYYDTRASNTKKGIRASYSLSNRAFKNRAMLTYSTGMLPSGWAFAFSGSKRWTDDGVIDGTYNNSHSYFASIEKYLTDKHRINFTAFGTPSRKSGSSPNTQEVYDFRGKNYNAYWGRQDNEKRNERIKKVFEPLFSLAHYWKINKKSQLTTSTSYQFGYNKNSRLNSYQANNPSPTYYKNLPSYWYSIGNTAQAEYLNNAWKENDESITQIDWNKLYFANEHAPEYTDPYSGQSGRRASYFLVNDVIKDKTFNASTRLQTIFAENWNLFLNLNYQNLNSDNYREVKDLLGSDFVINKSSFLKGDGSATSIDDYNILKPGSIAKKGDKTEYFYKFHRQEITANATSRIIINRWTIAISTLLSWNESYRDGKFKNGLYANNSYGKSSKENFVELGMRSGLTYKINGRNFIIINSAYFEQSPTLNEIFPNARLNNDVTPNITNSKINTNDITYVLRAPKVNGRISTYYTQIKDATEISRYYAQGVGLDGNTDAFIAEILPGVEKVYFGTEIGVEWKLTPTLIATGLASIGQFTYNNNPNLYISSDVSPGLHDYGKAYLKNYKLAGTPQKAYSLGLKYSSPKFWWIGITGNFLQDIYTNISSLSRTENFVSDPETGEIYPGVTKEKVKELLKQKQYQDVFMLNLNGGKSFRIGKYNMGIFFSIYNIFNERGYVTSSFEQGRTSSFKTALERNYFTDKIFYDKGRSFFINAYFRF